MSVTQGAPARDGDVLGTCQRPTATPSGQRTRGTRHVAARGAHACGGCTGRGFRKSTGLPATHKPRGGRPAPHSQTIQGRRRTNIINNSDRSSSISVPSRSPAVALRRPPSLPVALVRLSAGKRRRPAAPLRGQRWKERPRGASVCRDVFPYNVTLGGLVRSVGTQPGASGTQTTATAN